MVPIHEGLPGILVSKAPLLVEADQPVKVIGNEPSTVLVESNDEPLIVTNEAQPSPINEILPGILVSKGPLLVEADQPVKVIGNNPEQKTTVHAALPGTNNEPLVVTSEAQPSPNEILHILRQMSSVADKNHGK